MKPSIFLVFSYGCILALGIELWGGEMELEVDWKKVQNLYGCGRRCDGRLQDLEATPFSR